MKKSDSTSRITCWIQKLHSSSRTLVITFGTNLTERKAEEKEEYGYIPFGVNGHIKVRFGLHLEPVVFRHTVFRNAHKHRSITVYSGKAMFREV